MEQTRSGAFFSTTNIRNILAALAVGSFLVSPAFADIIDVGFGGSASGSGTVNVICTLGGPGCSLFPYGVPIATDSFSFSGTNTQLGTFSQSGQASATSKDGQVITVTGLVRQTTEVTSNSFAIDLLSQFSSVYIPLESGVFGSLRQYYSLGFTLTTESSMHMTSQFAEGSLFEFSDLYGPLGLVFTLPGPPDQTFTLEPGQYQFEFASGSSSPYAFELGPSLRGFDELETLSLNATFTPIPEPHWTPIVLGLISIGYYLLGQRRRCAC